MASILAFIRRLLRFFGLAGPEQDAHAAPPAPAPVPVAPVPAPAAPAPPQPHVEAEPGGVAPFPTPATLAMPQLMAISGQYPARGDGGTNAYFNQAMIQTFAGLEPAFGAPRAEGQILQIEVYMALFSLLGTTFGGDGIRTVGLPNLEGRIAIGGQPVGMMGQGTLTLGWLISTGPSTLAPVPGTLAMFGAGWAPDGWAICDGSLLPISQYVPLFEAIGCAFGGNNATVFALPDLAGGGAPVGAGQGPGLPPVTLGQQIAGPVPGLGLNYLIAVEGPSPPSGGTGAFPDTGQYLGQVIAYGGAQVPAGWALCDGSLLQISENEPLFQLIGTTWGGDGESDFALPDLRGRMVAGLPG